MRVEGVEDVDVVSVGSQLRVTVTSSDAVAGRAILQRAQALTSGGSVQVEQIAAADESARSL